MRKGRRRRRASLRGWWRALPFTVIAGALFFVFAWLHTQLLRNEYRAIEFTAEIQRVKDRIAALRGERNALGRLDRMQEFAPQHALIEPEPGQVQVVRPTSEEYMAMAAARRSAPKPVSATRSVVVLLKKSGEAAEPGMEGATPDTALAQRDSAGRAEEPGKL